MMKSFDFCLSEIMRRHFFILLAVCMCTMQMSSAFAAGKKPLRPGTDVETRITASKLTYHAEKRIVIFEGNVHVSRPDFDLKAATLTVYLKPAQTGKEDAPVDMAAGDVDRLVAQGKVSMSEPQGHSGTSEKATYTIDSGLLVLEGDPRLTDGENTISGEIIRYYTQENRSEVLGGSRKRVEAVFNSKGKR